MSCFLLQLPPPPEHQQPPQPQQQPQGGLQDQPPPYQPSGVQTIPPSQYNGPVPQQVPQQQMRPPGGGPPRGPGGTGYRGQNGYHNQGGPGGGQNTVIIRDRDRRDSGPGFGTGLMLGTGMGLMAGMDLFGTLLGRLYLAKMSHCIYFLGHVGFLKNKGFHPICISEIFYYAAD